MGIERFFNAKNKTFSYATNLAMETANKMGAAGKSMLSTTKGRVGLGTAGAIALAAVLSDPPKRPGGVPRVIPNTKGSSGGEGYQPMNVHLDGYVQGSPTVPNMVSTQNTARIGGSGGSAAQNYRIKVHGSSPGNIDYHQMGTDIQGAVGGGIINTRISDNRKSLTPQQISDIMTRG